MKALGIVRKLDELGRIVIPKEVRRTQGWGERHPMELFMSKEGLVIRSYVQQQEKVSVLQDLEQLRYFVKDEKGLAIIDDLKMYVQEGE